MQPQTWSQQYTAFPGKIYSLTFLRQLPNSWTFQDFIGSYEKHLLRVNVATVWSENCSKAGVRSHKIRTKANKKPVIEIKTLFDQLIKILQHNCWIGYNTQIELDTADK